LSPSDLRTKLCRQTAKLYRGFADREQSVFDSKNGLLRSCEAPDVHARSEPLDPIDIFEMSVKRWIGSLEGTQDLATYAPANWRPERPLLNEVDRTAEQIG